MVKSLLQSIEAMRSGQKENRNYSVVICNLYNWRIGVFLIHITWYNIGKGQGGRYAGL